MRRSPTGEVVVGMFIALHLKKLMRRHWSWRIKGREKRKDPHPLAFVF
jgi:hypothetical protein